MYSGTFHIYMLDVNHIHCMSWYMYNYWILELICVKDSNIAHWVTHDIKKMYSKRDKYTLIITKTSKVMLKIDMLCRIQEWFGENVRIRSELNCMHHYYSILHQKSMRKYKFFFLILIYIYLYRWAWWQHDISTWNWMEDQD